LDIGYSLLDISIFNFLQANVVLCPVQKIFPFANINPYFLNFRHSKIHRMIIQFQIEYKTYYGQRMMICGSLQQLGDGNREQAVAMEYVENSYGLWRLQIESDEISAFNYRYFIRDTYHTSDTDEWGEDRQFTLRDNNAGKIFLRDHWHSRSDLRYVQLSAAFTGAIFRMSNPVFKPEIKKTKKKNSIILRFRLGFSRVKAGQRLAIAGNTNTLGLWNENKVLLLGNQNFPEWEGEAVIPVSDFPVEYKYLVQNEKGETLFWERSGNRIISLPEGELPDVIEISDEQPDDPRLPWNGAGVAIPVFSLRRDEGMGVGEFTDLKSMTDWVVKTGLQMIQILPVNDTVASHSWKDSYPYAAISVFALHPIYINLLQIGRLHSKTTQKIITEQGALLNSLPKMDYEAVMSLKSRFFKLIYDEIKDNFLNDHQFIAFFSAHQHWLKPYAAFSYLRDLYQTPDFSRWGSFAHFTQEMVKRLTDPSAPHYDDIAIHYFIQYHAHLQLSEAAAYARSKGVVLKGDLPIGIFRNSVDAWVNPALYHMDCQAGAPPDDFSATGQNWRFPTYNWEAMAKDNYSWWQQRLCHMSDYFDAFRIDHILGFFRIWEIPGSQVQGLMGCFNPSIPYTRNEILSKGVYFDEDRFCQPYIREDFLYTVFGEDTHYVKSNCLFEYAPGFFKLLQEVDTQRKVEERFILTEDMGMEERNRTDRIRNGLFSLIAEVIFLKKQSDQGTFYFPRNSFHSTFSYRELDYFTRQKLDELYIDYFYHRNEDFWRDKAMTILPAIKSATNMLLCGEDLGMVPACVPSVMNELGILSLEVQRMPKNPKLEFGHPANYPYLSVATPSSHDTSTIRGWWEEDRYKTQKFYNQILGNYGDAPEICSPDIVRQIIVQHLYSPSMWTVFPLQDLLGLDEPLRFPDPLAERINEPGNPNHYWRYRMHLSLEKLMNQDDFNNQLRDLIQSAGRV
jgi:4-alpha-glucanotransferase